METAEPADPNACEAVEGRGCLAAEPPPALACTTELDSAAETGLLGVVEGGGCGCDDVAGPHGLDSPGFIGFLLVGCALVPWLRARR